MHQTVLVDTDVHERAEGGHVGDHALQDHPGGQVGDLLDALLEGGRPERGTRVSARLLQLLEDVGDGRQTEGVVHEVGRPQRAQHARVADEGRHLLARGLHHAAHHRVGLGVDAGGVQRIGAAADAQEARALLVRLRAEPRHLLQLGTGREGTVLVAVRDDVLRESGRDARHPREQRHGRRVDVHADAVYTVLHDRVQRAGQLHLGQVVLILADADRLGIDLHQLRQRVLKAPGDGDRAAQRHVHVRQLLGGVTRRGVHRRARLGHHHLGELQLRVLRDEFAGELVGLAGRRAVADRDQLDRVLLREPRQLGERLVPLVGRDVRVDHVRGDDLAGRVDHGDLHTRAEAGVQAERRAGAGRGGQQQVPQVRREHVDRLVLGGRPQPQAQVDPEVDQDAGAPGPADGVLQPLVARSAPVGDPEPRRDDPLVRGRALRGLLRLQDEVQDLLLLPAQHRQDPVRGQLGERLGEVEVVGELGARLLLALPHLRGQPPAHPHALAQLADEVGVLGEPLGEDRPRALQRGLRVGDALVGVHERGGGRQRFDRRVAQQPLRERFQARLARDLRLGAPLGLEGEVDVLQTRLRLGAADPRLQFLGELALLPHRLQDRGPPLLQLPQIAQPLLDGAQLRVVEHLGRFLAVASDEGHGGTAVEQFHRGLHLPLPYAEFLGDPAFDGPCSVGPGCRHDPVPPSPLRLRGNCGR